MRCGIVNHSPDSPATVGERDQVRRSDQEARQGIISRLFGKPIVKRAWHRLLPVERLAQPVEFQMLLPRIDELQYGSGRCPHGKVWNLETACQPDIREHGPVERMYRAKVRHHYVGGPAVLIMAIG